LQPLEIGAKRYADETNVFGYTHCIMAECNGTTLGMMNTFSIAPAADAPSSTEPAPEQPAHEPDVLAPYNLEAPNTWYICALAVFPEFRRQGVGTQCLTIAHQQAQTQGFDTLSLLCFEQNTEAVKLYQRQGFIILDRTPVVPHPLIHYTGDLLLMTAPVRDFGQDTVDNRQ
jgi:ribosomal protein S18 acetylase RimI-like enzyme